MSKLVHHAIAATGGAIIGAFVYQLSIVNKALDQKLYLEKQYKSIGQMIYKTLNTFIEFADDNQLDISKHSFVIEELSEESNNLAELRNPAPTLDFAQDITNQMLELLNDVEKTTKSTVLKRRIASIKESTVLPIKTTVDHTLRMLNEEYVYTLEQCKKHKFAGFIVRNIEIL